MPAMQFSHGFELFLNPYFNCEISVTVVSQTDCPVAFFDQKEVGNRNSLGDVKCS